MTRRDQTLRAWIERPSPRHHWQSCISFRGRTYQKSTHSKIRKAAKEFNLLHLTHILRNESSHLTQTHHQLELPPT
jgi:hypothetical protein